MSRSKKKKSKPPIITETIDQYLSRGGSISIHKPKEPVYKLLYSSGHFNAKKTKSGAMRKKGSLK